MKQHKCIQCRQLFTEAPKAILEWWLFDSVCKQIHKLDKTSKTYGKLHKARIVYCGTCI